MRRNPVAGSEIISFLAPRLRQLLEALPEEIKCTLEEIRLRQGRPLLLRTGEEEFTVLPSTVTVSSFSGVFSGGSRGSGSSGGFESPRSFGSSSGSSSGSENAAVFSGSRDLGRLQVSRELGKGLIVEKEDLEKTMQIISQNSLYALEEEIKNGFITLPGGHRVGMAGQVVLEKGRVKTLKHISCLNFRCGREVKGAANALLPYLISGRGGRPYHTLLVSPPRGGKTTLLRDIVRQLSNGIPALGFEGVTVGLVDERSEVAGCYQGVPQRDVGIRTDVLDRCPKAEGMIMLLRSMSPQVIAVDELGRPEDREAVEEALNAGVTVITTAHGFSLSDLARRPVVRELIERQVFERIVILGRSQGPGTIEAVWDGKKQCLLQGGGENAQTGGGFAGDRGRAAYRLGNGSAVSPAS